MRYVSTVTMHTTHTHTHTRTHICMYAPYDGAYYITAMQYSNIHKTSIIALRWHRVAMNVWKRCSIWQQLTKELESRNLHVQRIRYIQCLVANSTALKSHLYSIHKNSLKSLKNSLPQPSATYVLSPINCIQRPSTHHCKTLAAAI